MRNTRHLTVPEVTALNDQILLRMDNRHGQLINQNALAGALGRPHNAARYAGADRITQAAYLIEGVALAHAFLDGNKRTAWVTGRIFLRLNGLRFHLVPTDAPDEDGRQVEALALPPRPSNNLELFTQWLRARVHLTVRSWLAITDHAELVMACIP